VIQIISTFAPANKNPNTSPKTRMCKHDLPNLNFWLLSFWGPFFTQISSTTQPQIQPYSEDLYLQPIPENNTNKQHSPLWKKKTYLPNCWLEGPLFLKFLRGVVFHKPKTKIPHYELVSPFQNVQAAFQEGEAAEFHAS